MPRDKSLAADALRFALAAVYVAATMAFLTLPYALSAIPGDAAPNVAAAAPHHSG